jgi:hypothetical protein
MKKIAVLLVLFIALVTTLVALAREPHTRLELVNQTDQVVTLLLDNDAFYALNVSPGETRVFTIERGVYAHTTFACEKMTSGYVSIETQLRLVFTNCAVPAVNQGEPSLEKVHLYDSPKGSRWYYQMLFGK